jgi:hypothetical protein
MAKEFTKPSPKLLEKTHHLMHEGFHTRAFPDTGHGLPEALGDARWTDELITATWYMAETGKCPDHLNYKTGRSGGGFDRLAFKSLPKDQHLAPDAEVDISLELNRRGDGRNKRRIAVPWYGGGMSYGSVSVNVMMSRALAAKKWDTLMSTGEGGYPEELYVCKEHVITQVATGYFGVEEKSIQAAPIIEFKYAQGAKPGLGGHLLATKAGEEVAKMRGSGGIRTADDMAKAIALGADGCVLGTSDLVAMGCTRCSNCEGGPSGRGCPWGLTTTDVELQEYVQQAWGAERLNMYYTALSNRIKEILRELGLSTIGQLRGRTDLLRYISGGEA